MTRAAVRYTVPPGANEHEHFVLVAYAGTGDEMRFRFSGQLEIGRDDGREDVSGVLLIGDPKVSRRHCVLTGRPDGRCFIRDLSLNGTRVDGRRLVPNVEVELRAGQTIAVADGFDLVLEATATPRGAAPDLAEMLGATMRAGEMTIATVLVGDIRDFTVLVRTVPPDTLQPSVNRVFSLLADRVGALGGTVKEFQGDALVAFWERSPRVPRVAEAACHAALELDCMVDRLAADRSVWKVEGHRLHMDWALATGLVMIHGFGGAQPAGLSMIGEPMVAAFRLEKFANATTGRILACPETSRMAAPMFEFRNLGRMQAKGFDKPDHVFALERARPEQRDPRRAADL
jgi:class 3 adenylate cyclase